MKNVKEYSNGEIAIIWKPKCCNHSGICCKLLPKVYDIDRRPWIDPLGATSDQIIEQVSKCPTGALSYRILVL